MVTRRARLCGMSKSNSIFRQRAWILHGSHESIPGASFYARASHGYKSHLQILPCPACPTCSPPHAKPHRPTISGRKHGDSMMVTRRARLCGMFKSNSIFRQRAWILHGSHESIPGASFYARASHGYNSHLQILPRPACPTCSPPHAKPHRPTTSALGLSGA